MERFQKAGNAEGLLQIIRQSEYGPDEVSHPMCERLIALAAERTQARGESAMDSDRRKDYLFTSDWQNMVRDKLGAHGDRANQFALGVIDFDVSEGRDAYLVEDAIVPQWKWLESGDGRMNDVIEVDLTHTDYHKNVREMWWPQDYTLVVTFEDSLVKGQAKLADAL